MATISNNEEIDLKGLEEFINKQDDRFVFFDDTLLGYIKDDADRNNLKKNFDDLKKYMESKCMVWEVKHRHYEAYGAVGGRYMATKKSK